METPFPKRFNGIRCRISDLYEGVYDPDKRVIYTVFGELKRVRIVGTALYIKIIEENEIDDMIKSFDENGGRVSILVADGTGIIWVNLLNAYLPYYKNLRKGDLLHISGIVRKNESGPVILGDFAVKIDDPNYETLHLAEMISRIIKDGKKEIPKHTEIKQESVEQKEPDTTDNIEDSIISEDIIPDIDEGIDLEEIDRLLMEDIAELGEEIGEEEIIETIKKLDKGTGVALEAIARELHIDPLKLEDTLRRLEGAGRILSDGAGHYSVF